MFLLRGLERQPALNEVQLENLADAIYQGEFIRYEGGEIGSLASGWAEGFSIPFIRKAGRDEYELDTRWLSHAPVLAEQWWFLMSLTEAPGFRQQQLLEQIPHLSQHLTPEIQRDIEAEAQIWRDRFARIEQACRMAPSQRPSSWRVSLKEWSDMALAGTDEFAHYDPQTRQLTGARGTHDCVVYALVDTGWEESDPWPPVNLYHASPRTTRERVEETLADLRLAMRPGAELIAPVIGGQSTDLRLLDDVLLSLQATGIPLHSLNFRETGIEHFTIAPKTAELKEIIAPAF